LINRSVSRQLGALVARMGHSDMRERRAPDFAPLNPG
jgi:hypothetical protein